MSDHETEAAYRRGFHQGAHRLFKFVEHHLPPGIEEIAQRYVEVTLMNWRHKGGDETDLPPEVA